MIISDVSSLPLLFVRLFVFIYNIVILFVTEQTSVLYIFMNSSSIIDSKYINVIFPDMYYLENKHWLMKCNCTPCVYCFVKLVHKTPPPVRIFLKWSLNIVMGSMEELGYCTFNTFYNYLKHL